MLFQGGLPDREPGQRPWNRYPIFNAHSSNKLSMTVNLKTSEGLEIFKRLVSKSDVLVENNVTETMGKLGISYEMLKEQKNDFIMMRMPAYGSTGPYSNYRAFGVHIEGVIGHSVMRGYTDMDPSSNTAVYVADAAGGAQGAFAVLAALNYRRRTGKGSACGVVVDRKRPALFRGDVHGLLHEQPQPGAFGQPASLRSPGLLSLQRRGPVAEHHHLQRRGMGRLPQSPGRPYVGRGRQVLRRHRPPPQPG